MQHGTSVTTAPLNTYPAALQVALAARVPPAFVEDMAKLHGSTVEPRASVFDIIRYVVRLARQAPALCHGHRLTLPACGSPFVIVLLSPAASCQHHRSACAPHPPYMTRLPTQDLAAGLR